jgi:hypothetical protein
MTNLLLPGYSQKTMDLAEQMIQSTRLNQLKKKLEQACHLGKQAGHGYCRKDHGKRKQTDTHCTILTQTRINLDI